MTTEVIKVDKVTKPERMENDVKRSRSLRNLRQHLFSVRGSLKRSGKERPES